MRSLKQIRGDLKRCRDDIDATLLDINAREGRLLGLWREYKDRQTEETEAMKALAMQTAESV